MRATDVIAIALCSFCVACGVMLLILRLDTSPWTYVFLSVGQLAWCLLAIRAEQRFRRFLDDLRGASRKGGSS